MLKDNNTRNNINIMLAIQDIKDVLIFTDKLISNLDEYIDIFYAMYPKDLEKEQLRDKLIAETSLLLFLVNRLANQLDNNFNQFEQESLALLNNISKKTAKYARNSSKLFLLAQNPQAVIGVGLSHIMLSKIGLPDSSFDNAIKSAFASEFVNSIERPNFRQMELVWLQGIFNNSKPDFSQLLPASIIHKSQHPIYMRREDAYATTHIAMYLSNFGEYKLTNFMNETEITNIHAFIDHSISWCLAYEDWDLLIEILIVHCLINYPISQYSLIANKVLSNIFKQINATKPIKSIHSLNLSSEIAASLDSAKQNAYFMMQSYHTTYVYGILRTIELYTNWYTNDNNIVLPNEILLAINNGHFNDTIFNYEPLLNAKLIYLAREEQYNKLLVSLEEIEESTMPRIMQTCSICSDKLINFINAKSYDARQMENT